LLKKKSRVTLVTSGTQRSSGGGSLETSIYSNRRILVQFPAGGHDFYVAITRATHRRTVVREGALPAALHRLAS
jgi:hypothetical protein